LVRKTVILGFATVVVSILFFNYGDFGGSPASTVSESFHQPDAAPSMVERGNAPIIGSVELSSGREIPRFAELSPPDAAEIEKIVTEAQTQFRAIEAKNVTVVINQEIDGGSLIALSVTSPVPEQIAQFHSIAAAASKESDLTGPAKSRLDSMLRSQLASYTNFPKTHRILLAYDYAGKAGQLYEYFADGAQSRLPDALGKISLGPDDHYKWDNRFGEKDSWASKRYGHLLQVEHASK
jgi:hypothetical protein